MGGSRNERSVDDATFGSSSAPASAPAGKQPGKSARLEAAARYCARPTLQPGEGAVPPIRHDNGRLDDGSGNLDDSLRRPVDALDEVVEPATRALDSLLRFAG